jgi:hypothetical protein
MAIRKGFIAEATLRSPAFKGLDQEEEATNTKRANPKKYSARLVAWHLGD